MTRVIENVTGRFQAVVGDASDFSGNSVTKDNVSVRFRIGGGSSAIRERAPFLTSFDSVRRDYGATL